MDQKALYSFVTAIETGSLSAAARRVGISQPAMSQKLAALERSLGQQLLIRSRHGVRPTPAGEIAYSHGMKVLGSVAEMEEALDALKGDVAGRLKVTTNVLFGQAVMGPLIAELRERYPRLRIDVITTDQLLDIEAEGVDIAVRSGSVGKGGGKVRRVGSLAGALVASRAYLEAVGRPRGPEDLGRLGYIQYRDDPEEHQVMLEHGGGRILAPVTPSFSAQHPELTLHAVTGGLGFAKAPRFYVQDKLHSGTLEEVLPGFVPAAKPIYLLQLEHVIDSARARVFREAVLRHLAGVDGIDIVAGASDTPPAVSDADFPGST